MFTTHILIKYMQITSKLTSSASSAFSSLNYAASSVAKSIKVQASKFASLRVFATFAICAIISVSSAVSSHAAQGEAKATFIGTSKGWSVYKLSNGTKYMFSYPTKQAGTFSKREKPYLMISNFNGDLEASVYEGFTFKHNTPVKVAIAMSYKDESNKKHYSMYPTAEMAWLGGGKAEEQAFVKDLKLGANVQVKGISHKNTNALDTYSLDGFMGAYNMLVDPSK